jgi:hypothetical protein
VTLVRRATALLLVLLSVAIALPAATARPARAAEPQFALLAQPAWTPEHGDVTLRLDIPASLLPQGEDVQLRLRMHNAVTTTTAFDRTIEGDRLGNRIDTKTVAVTGLPRDAQGAAYITFGLQGSLTEPHFDASMPPGVYPLELALRTDKTLASFVTWIVVADPTATPADTDPVRLASVWSVVAAPARNADGSTDASVVDELEPGGRLSDIADLLDTAGSLPITLEVGPETLESWDALAQADPRLGAGVASVKAAVERPGNQLLPAPYVPIDLTSLEAAGLGAQLPEQLRTGSSTLDRITGVSPDTRTAFVDPIDPATLARIRGLLVDRVVVRAPSIADIARDDTLAPFALNAGDGTTPAAATSPQYEDLLTSDAPPALRAQRLLAALSVLTFERDESAGVVLATPARWTPDLATERSVLQGLRDNPYIQPVTLDQLFTSIPPATRDDEPVVRNLAPHQPAPFPISAATYSNAQGELAALQSTVGADDPEIAAGAQGLRLALSTDNTPAQADADLAVIGDALAAVQQGVSTTGRRVTVTARRADIPLSFLNQTGKPVTVRVQLASEKLLFPDGADKVLVLPEGTTTQRFAVEARTSGTFTMTVSLATGDGVVPLGQPEKVSVRSAVFSGAGAALTVGALLFLALWWANHFRRTRRARRAVAAP